MNDLSFKTASKEYKENFAEKKQINSFFFNFKTLYPFLPPFYPKIEL